MNSGIKEMKEKFINGSWKFYLLMLILLSSCSHKQTEELSFDKTVYSPSYSSNFKIEGNESSEDVLISVYNPWQGAEEISSQLLISRDENHPDNFSGQILNGNAERIICMSSTHIAMLDALNATDKIVGVSGKEYISNPKIAYSSRYIPDIGYEGNIDYEKIITVQPDLILLFSVNGASGMEPKLKELGIPFLYVGDYVEEDPLGKSEWIIPLAEVLGIREKGIEKFEEISSRYNALKNHVANNTNDLNNPKIMVNAPFLDSWFMPSTESYVAKMIKDAGGEYIYDKNTGNSSQPIDMEEALKLVSEADYWINIGTVRNKEELIKTFPKFSSAPCVLSGKIYNNNFRSTPGGGNDCYESGVVNPDIVLKDMIKIFHPDLAEEDFVYYHRLE